MNNITKSAIKTLAIPDTGDNVIPQLQVQMYDTVKNCGKLGNYGLYGNAPINSYVITMQINGQEEVLFGIEDDVNNRPRNLKEGEVMLYNTKAKNSIYLKDDGSIEIKGDVKIIGKLYADTIEAGNGATLSGSDTVSVTKGIVTGA